MNARLKKEIDAVRKASQDGRLHADKMLEVAKEDPESELYRNFEWDDDVAGEKYRLEQAKNLIRTYIIMLPRIDRKVRAYISLPSDRDHGGGFRQTERVVRNSSQRNQMITEALEAARSLRRRYFYLPELDQFFDDVDELVANWADKLEVELPTQQVDKTEPVLAGD